MPLTPSNTLAFSETWDFTFPATPTSAFDETWDFSFPSTGTTAFTETWDFSFPSTGTTAFDETWDFSFSTASAAFDETWDFTFPATPTDAFTETWDFTFPATGTTAFDETWDFSFPSTGTTAFDETWDFSFPATSTTAFDETWDLGIYEGEGGVTIGGSANYLFDPSVNTYTGSGGLTIGGSPSYSFSSGHIYAGSGGLTLGGSPSYLYDASGNSYTGSGGLTIGGSPSYSHSGAHVYIPSGGLVLGGSPSYSLHVSKHSYSGSGGLILGGAAQSNSVLHFIYYPDPDIFLGGAAITLFIGATNFILTMPVFDITATFIAPQTFLNASLTTPLLKAIGPGEAELAECEFLIKIHPEIYKEERLTFELTSDSAMRYRLFLRAIDDAMCEFRGLLANLPTFLDPTEAPYPILPLLAPIVGIDFNFDVPEDVARREIVNAIFLWERKGTRDNFSDWIRFISGFRVNIREFYKEVFRSNVWGQAYHQVEGTTDPVVWREMWDTLLPVSSLSRSRVLPPSVWEEEWERIRPGDPYATLPHLDEHHKTNTWDGNNIVGPFYNYHFQPDINYGTHGFTQVGTFNGYLAGSEIYTEHWDPFVATVVFARHESPPAVREILPGFLFRNHIGIYLDIPDSNFVDTIDSTHASKPTSDALFINDFTITTGLRVIFTSLTGLQARDNFLVFDAIVNGVGGVTWTPHRSGAIVDGVHTAKPTLDTILINGSMIRNGFLVIFTALTGLQVNDNFFIFEASVGDFGIVTWTKKDTISSLTAEEIGIDFTWFGKPYLEIILAKIARVLDLITLFGVVNHLFWRIITLEDAFLCHQYRFEVVPRFIEGWGKEIGDDVELPPDIETVTQTTNCDAVREEEIECFGDTYNIDIGNAICCNPDVCEGRLASFVLCANNQVEITNDGWFSYYPAKYWSHQVDDILQEWTPDIFGTLTNTTTIPAEYSLAEIFINPLIGTGTGQGLEIPTNISSFIIDTCLNALFEDLIVFEEWDEPFIQTLDFFDDWDITEVFTPTLIFTDMWELPTFMSSLIFSDNWNYSVTFMETLDFFDDWEISETFTETFEFFDDWEDNLPMLIPGNQVWLDGNNGPMGNSPIHTWLDRSGSDNDAKQTRDLADGRQEVPPNPLVTAEAYGEFSLNTLQTELTFTIVITSPLTGPIVGAHFHTALVGFDGPIRRDFTSSFIGNTATGIWKNTDSQPLTSVRVTELLAEQIYFNIHTSAYPGGEIRGQVTTFFRRPDHTVHNPSYNNFGTVAFDGVNDYMVIAENALLDTDKFSLYVVGEWTTPTNFATFVSKVFDETMTTGGWGLVQNGVSGNTLRFFVDNINTHFIDYTLPNGTPVIIRATYDQTTLAMSINGVPITSGSPLYGGGTTNSPYELYVGAHRKLSFPATGFLSGTMAEFIYYSRILTEEEELELLLYLSAKYGIAVTTEFPQFSEDWEFNTTYSTANQVTEPFDFNTTYSTMNEVTEPFDATLSYSEMVEVTEEWNETGNLVLLVFENWEFSVGPDDNLDPLMLVFGKFRRA